MFGKLELLTRFMLQQTRIEAAIPYYEKFIAAAPDAAALASLTDDALLKLWEGLGYYSRARNLKKAAVMLAALGGIIAPIFKPLGFEDWRVSTALITGFTAKESVVSTLTVLLGGTTDALKNLFAPFTAFVFLTFTLLYTPCVAAIASVKRELGGKWAVGIVFLQCLIAWLAAFAVHLIGVLAGIA